MAVGRGALRGAGAGVLLVPLALLLRTAGATIMRPHMYFGTTTESAFPVRTSLAWFGDHRFTQVRHRARNEDQVKSWGWRRHDGVRFGDQFVDDPNHGVSLRIKWLRLGETSNAPWVARVTGDSPRVRDAPPADTVSLLLFVAADGGSVNVTRTRPKGTRGNVTVVGTAGDGTAFRVSIPRGATQASGVGTVPSLTRFDRVTKDMKSPSKFTARAHVHGSPISTGATWDVDAVTQRVLRLGYKKTVERLADSRVPIPDRNPIVPLLDNVIADNSSVMCVQLVVLLPFQVDIQFEFTSSAHPVNLTDLSSRTIARLLHEARTEFDARAASTFGVATRGTAPGGDGAAASGGAAVLGADVAAGRGGDAAAGRGGDVAAGRGALPAFQRQAASALLASGTFLFGDVITVLSSGRASPRGRPRGLYCHFPSRTELSRGFLWDEGFHAQLLAAWDSRLAVRTLSTWLDAVDVDSAAPEEVGTVAAQVGAEVPLSMFEDGVDPATLMAAAHGGGSAFEAPGGGADQAAQGRTTDSPKGWMPTVQILGDESAMAVSPALVPQRLDSTAPPSFVLAIETLIRQALGRGERSASMTSAGVSAMLLPWARRYLPKLRANYEWYKRNRRSAVGDGFRWRGGTRNATLESAVGDYPRAMVPSQWDQHVDLLAWMAKYASVMSDVAFLAGERKEPYLEDLRRFMRQLDKHWNDGRSAYCDLIPQDARHFHAQQSMQHNCHVGYVSHLPLFLKLLRAEDRRVGRMLDALEDPAGLWSAYGLRSLSPKDSRSDAVQVPQRVASCEQRRRQLQRAGDACERATFTGQFRGHIWGSFNYLAVAALRHYADQPGPFQARAGRLAGALAGAFAANVEAQWAETGRFWEYYDAETGEGMGASPFAGWTSLVALM